MDFNASEVTDADLIHLKGLKRLEILNFTDTKITDAGLDLLNGSGVLASLHALVLSGTEITDAGISVNMGATRLKSLVIDRTNISDAGLAHLKGLTDHVRGQAQAQMRVVRKLQ